MQKQQLFDLQEGDCIYVYSGGHLEAQGRYIGVIKDKNESFLCWRKHNGNQIYTNLNGISVETMNENTAYLENTRETCERGYVDNQNTSHMYDQSYNHYDQNMDTTYQPSYDNYDASGTYDDRYNPNTSDSYNHYNQNSNATYDQGWNNNYEQVDNNYDQNTGSTYNNNSSPNASDTYNQSYKNSYQSNPGCTCNQG
ncbi:hypothetical protein [Bacillus thuringiensis]|uniref:hypothetical protein n=1 Tax=Bacillus thuringiensis TaxID=1428 RepID=UPI0015938F37|nr:hypothetical protein [Bacillus thuringiensis]